MKRPQANITKPNYDLLMQTAQKDALTALNAGDSSLARNSLTLVLNLIEDMPKDTQRSFATWGFLHSDPFPELETRFKQELDNRAFHVRIPVTEPARPARKHAALKDGLLRAFRLK